MLVIIVFAPCLPPPLDPANVRAGLLEALTALDGGEGELVIMEWLRRDQEVRPPLAVK